MPRKAAATALAMVENAQPSVDSETFNQMIGAAKYASYIHNQTKSDIVRFLSRVRDERLFIDQGFDQFDDFLNSNQSPMSQRTFYRELELFEAEGEQYDLFNEWKLPVRLRKQLAAGDVVLDGDEIVIGRERYGFGEGKVIKAAFEQLVKEKIAAEEKAAQREFQLSRAEEKIHVAVQNIDILEQNVERLRAGTPHDQQMSDTLRSLATLTQKIGQLADEEKKTKGATFLPLLERALETIATAYGLELFGGAK